MNRAHVPIVAAVVLLVTAQLGSAQDLSRYRDYVLESSLESVAAAIGPRAGDARTLHERPATIQELQWRVPYASSENELADSVRGAVFTFCDDALYQVVVSYDRDRTNELTDHDIVDSLSAVYGKPVLASARTRPAAVLANDVIVAQWDGTASSLTLLRGAYTTEFHLVLISKALSVRARNAIREAERLDAIEAPRRELEQRKKDVADAAADRDRIRAENKAGFRP